MTPDDSNLIDRCIIEFDAALRTVAGQTAASRASPASAAAESPLSAAERDLAARLMRVNHAGELAAQALYRGQGLVARDATLRAELMQAARDEHDHLAWCEARTRELGKDVSLLAPFWYLASLGIGACAGLAGDRASLGFLAETERQVAEHLDGHLRLLPGQDQRSRRIVAEMRTEEIGHREHALRRGAAPMPAPVRFGMRFAARVMTTVAHFL
jgi:ubiquinone biosynthesis monooxygenase Coq7